MSNAFKEEREKLSKMNFRQKVDYIWTYYKFWMLIFAVCILVVAAFVQAQLAYNPDAMTMLMCDTYCEDTHTAYQSINDDFREYIALYEEEKDPISFDDTISFSARNSDASYAAMLQKLMALVLSGGADLMVGPASAIEYYGAQNMFSDLEEVLPQDLFEQLKEEGVLFETTYTPTEEEMADGAVERTFYCGIRLDNVSYFQEKGIMLEDMAIGVIISGNHQDLALDFINMLFGRDSVMAIENMEG
ncbi:hypothetical protein HNP82_000015 [Catenibacillus scindens]|uniref:Uncharacterized protein n=1 Tax=Catenibacillus scindens TaxID=673271 RepID=A0A7W8H6R8_9FIRM|nr:hypothetical protein [Catenibacillus scindens]MBB5262921.1 hypothetical protein [Catenibacillus scindens]